MDEFAKGLPDLDSLNSHDDIKSCLQRRGLEKTWYAIIYRGLESDGNVAVMPVYGRPFEGVFESSSNFGPSWPRSEVIDRASGLSITQRRRLV